MAAARAHIHLQTSLHSRLFGRTHKLKPRTIIHAGIPKTGSSALQDAFLRQRHSLQAANVYYPDHKVDVNRVSSGTLPRTATLIDHCWKPSHQECLRLWREFEESGLERLLLSSEFYFLPDFIRTLASVYPDASVIAFLRDPVELLESAYIQKVKRSGETRRIDASAKALHIQLSQVELFTDIVEENFLHPISLLDYSLSAGNEAERSLMNRFLQAAEIDLHPIQIPIINKRYSFESLEFMRNANGFMPKSQRSRADKVLQDYSEGTRDYFLIAREDAIFLYGAINTFIKQDRFRNPRLREFLRAASESGLEMLAKREPAAVMAAKPDVDLSRVARHLEQHIPDFMQELRNAVSTHSETPQTTDSFRLSLEC